MTICIYSYFPLWFRRRDFGSDCITPGHCLSFTFDIEAKKVKVLYDSVDMQADLNLPIAKPNFHSMLLIEGLMKMTMVYTSKVNFGQMKNALVGVLYIAMFKTPTSAFFI